MREPFFNDDILVAYADGELLEPTAEAVSAMAMRDPAIAGRIGIGRWLLKAVADLTSRKARSDEYWPASGGQDLALVLGLGRSLSQQEERQFLANGWGDR